MPKDKNLHKVLVIGSGPIVIGQAAEFDYAGTQACRALREEGLAVVLVNSNPATIMTDTSVADAIYIEPLTLDVVKRIILREKPDGVLSTMGGQTGLTLSMQMAREGFLARHNVRLLGAKVETIDKAEDRQLFKDAMEAIGQPCVPSVIATELDTALTFAQKIGYPVIVRPAFTLGGSGGGIAEDEASLLEIAGGGLRLSPIGQILVEKCISGWQEIEFEVIRDGAGNAITVCSMENIDPVGVHTGDSVVVAPALTLTAAKLDMLRGASLSIVDALGVEGGCNCQFALHPETGEYAVIEVNPRVSRSSALASKATGYPIAKVAAKIAVGYHLDEIQNVVTGRTTAALEPAIDYVVVKYPKWPFDKFVYAKRTLGTQMKATGEVMSIGAGFEMAMMKAVRSLELNRDTFGMPGLSDQELHRRLGECDDERLFVVFEALRRGVSTDTVWKATRITPWFLDRLSAMARLETALEASRSQSEEAFYALADQARKWGYLDATIERLSGRRPAPAPGGYKIVDTCAAEFEARTPYFYRSGDVCCEAADRISASGDSRGTVVVLGSGPIRIGQGIEFDYCSVHCAQTCREAGFQTVMINNNPETVSTDFDTADRLYFDPLTFEDVMSVLAVEKPLGVVVQFGGQTAIKLARKLCSAGVALLGTDADSIDEAEDRERFDALLARCGIPRPRGATAFTTEDALKTAQSLGYPVLLRPSYVLGGQNMIIAHEPGDITEYMSVITREKQESPVLIDQYLMGVEIEVDAICDGEDILIPGIMEHIDRAGIHSGDSLSLYPALHTAPDIVDDIVRYTRILAKELRVLGLVNIQFVVYDGRLYVIEVNPRSSRTIPYISKVTGVPMVALATRCMLGEKLRDMPYGTGLFPKSRYVAVKVPVFSFEKLHDVDTHLGPEMKSTGEALGLGFTLDEALLKGLVAAGHKMKKMGGIFLTVRDADKREALDLAKRAYALGFDLYATEGTAAFLNQNKVACNRIRKIGHPKLDPIALLESGKIDYVISTSSKGRQPARDSVKIRRKATERAIPCLTSLDTAGALINCLEMDKTMENMTLFDIRQLNNRPI